MSTPALRSGKVVVACASFKGTLSSKAAGEALARGLAQAGISAEVVALADGGEGLVEAIVAQVPGAQILQACCRGPRLERVLANYALLPRPGARRAVIEMAASSGLPLLAPEKRDPKLTTSLGVGDQILAALAQPNAPQELLLGLGGSATNDGGAGMAQALGARLLDKQGQDLPPGGAALRGLARIDLSRLDPRLARMAVIVACDVRNPLCGPQGASWIFGKQKGGSPEDLKLLDEALAHYGRMIERDLGRAVAEIPGAGAAGGLGAGCLAFLNATLKSGTELVLDAVEFERRLAGAALVLTGEGFLDEQTLMGKAPAGVAARARARQIPCRAIGGGVEDAQRAALERVFSGVESLTEFAGSAQASLSQPAHWLEMLAKQKARQWLG